MERKTPARYPVAPVKRPRHIVHLRTPYFKDPAVSTLVPLRRRMHLRMRATKLLAEALHMDDPYREVWREFKHGKRPDWYYMIPRDKKYRVIEYGHMEEEAAHDKVDILEHEDSRLLNDFVRDELVNEFITQQQLKRRKRSQQRVEKTLDQYITDVIKSAVADLGDELIPKPVPSNIMISRYVDTLLHQELNQLQRERSTTSRRPMSFSRDSLDAVNNFADAENLVRELVQQQSLEMGVTPSEEARRRAEVTLTQVDSQVLEDFLRRVIQQEQELLEARKITSRRVDLASSSQEVADFARAVARCEAIARDDEADGAPATSSSRQLETYVRDVIGRELRQVEKAKSVGSRPDLQLEAGWTVEKFVRQLVWEEAAMIDEQVARLSEEHLPAVESMQMEKYVSDVIQHTTGSMHAAHVRREVQESGDVEQFVSDLIRKELRAVEDAPSGSRALVGMRGQAESGPPGRMTSVDQFVVGMIRRCVDSMPSSRQRICKTQLRMQTGSQPDIEPFLERVIARQLDEISAERAFASRALDLNSAFVVDEFVRSIVRGALARYRDILTSEGVDTGLWLEDEEEDTGEIDAYIGRLVAHVKTGEASLTGSSVSVQIRGMLERLIQAEIEQLTDTPHEDRPEYLRASSTVINNYVKQLFENVAFDAHLQRKPSSERVRSSPTLEDFVKLRIRLALRDLGCGKASDSRDAEGTSNGESDERVIESHEAAATDEAQGASEKTDGSPRTEEVAEEPQVKEAESGEGAADAGNGGNDETAEPGSQNNENGELVEGSEQLPEQELEKAEEVEEAADGSGEVEGEVESADDVKAAFSAAHHRKHGTRPLHDPQHAKKKVTEGHRKKSDAVKSEGHKRKKEGHAEKSPQTRSKSRVTQQKEVDEENHSPRSAPEARKSEPLSPGTRDFDADITDSEAALILSARNSQRRKSDASPLTSAQQSQVLKSMSPSPGRTPNASSFSMRTKQNALDAYIERIMMAALNIAHDARSDTSASTARAIESYIARIMTKARDILDDEKRLRSNAPDVSGRSVEKFVSKILSREKSRVSYASRTKAASGRSVDVFIARVVSKAKRLVDAENETDVTMRVESSSCVVDRYIKTALGAEVEAATRSRKSVSKSQGSSGLDSLISVLVENAIQRGGSGLEVSGSAPKVASQTLTPEQISQLSEQIGDFVVQLIRDEIDTDSARRDIALVDSTASGASIDSFVRAIVRAETNQIESNMALTVERRRSGSGTGLDDFVKSFIRHEVEQDADERRPVRLNAKDSDIRTASYQAIDDFIRTMVRVEMGALTQEQLERSNTEMRCSSAHIEQYIRTLIKQEVAGIEPGISDDIVTRYSANVSNFIRDLIRREKGAVEAERAVSRRLARPVSADEIRAYVRCLVQQQLGVVERELADFDELHSLLRQSSLDIEAYVRRFLLRILPDNETFQAINLPISDRTQSTTDDSRSISYKSKSSGSKQRAPPTSRVPDDEATTDSARTETFTETSTEPTPREKAVSPEPPATNDLPLDPDDKVKVVGWDGAPASSTGSSKDRSLVGSSDDIANFIDVIISNEVDKIAKMLTGKSPRRAPSEEADSPLEGFIQSMVRMEMGEVGGAMADELEAAGLQPPRIKSDHNLLGADRLEDLVHGMVSDEVKRPPPSALTVLTPTNIDDYVKTVIWQAMGEVDVERAVSSSSRVLTTHLSSYIRATIEKEAKSMERLRPKRSMTSSSFELNRLVTAYVHKFVNEQHQAWLDSQHILSHSRPQSLEHLESFYNVTHRVGPCGRRPKRAGGDFEEVMNVHDFRSSRSFGGSPAQEGAGDQEQPNSLTQLLQRLLERNESPLAPEDACEIESPTLVEDLLAMNRRFEFEPNENWLEVLSTTQIRLLYKVFECLDFEFESRIKSDDIFTCLYNLHVRTSTARMPQILQEISCTNSNRFTLEEFLFIMGIVEQYLEQLSNLQRHEEIQRRVRADRVGMARNATRLRDVVFETKTKMSVVHKHYRSKLFNLPDRGLKMSSYLQTHLLDEEKMDEIFHELARHFPPDVRSPYMAEPYPLIPDWRDYEERQKRLFQELIVEQKKVVDLAKRTTEKELGLESEDVEEEARVSFDVDTTPTELPPPRGVPRGTTPLHYECFEQPKPCFKDMDAYSELLRECQKLRKICREMRRPLSSVLPNLDLDEARIRAMRRQRAKSTEPPRMVSSYDHGSLRRFRIPAIDKIRNLLQADHQKKFTRDTDKEARHQMVDAIEEFYGQLRDNLVQAGRQSWKHSHTDRIRSRRMREQFQRMHHVYYPRNPKHILVKDMQLAQSGSHFNFFDKDIKRKMTEHDLEISPLAQAMYIADAREDYMKAHDQFAVPPPTTENPLTAQEVPPV